MDLTRSMAASFVDALDFLAWSCTWMQCCDPVDELGIVANVRTVALQLIDV